MWAVRLAGIDTWRFAMRRWRPPGHDNTKDLRNTCLVSGNHGGLCGWFLAEGLRHRRLSRLPYNLEATQGQVLEGNEEQ